MSRKSFGSADGAESWAVVPATIGSDGSWPVLGFTSGHGRWALLDLTELAPVWFVHGRSFANPKIIWGWIWGYDAIFGAMTGFY